MRTGKQDMENRGNEPEVGEGADVDRYGTRHGYGLYRVLGRYTDFVCGVSGCGKRLFPLFASGPVPSGQAQLRAGR